MTQPVVSVLITAYNREKFVAQAIESALASTLAEIEVIVCDDCSTDDTWHIALEYARLDSRVRVFRNDDNIGDNPNRNRAASHARGTFLKYLDSDDTIYSHGLSVFTAAMLAFPEAGLGLSELPDGAQPYPREMTPYQAYRDHFFSQDLFGRAPGSSIIRRTAFEAVGGFREFRERGSLGDLELWLKLARRFNTVKLPRDLVWDRQHGNQESTVQRNAPLVRAKIDRQLQVEALNAEDCPLSNAERRKAVQRLNELDSLHVLRQAVIDGSPIQALRFARAVGVPLGSLITVVSRRLSR